MKKIKYIMLAVVLCLGLIGGAYAYWTDQVVIDGSVTTGKIDVTFEGVTSPGYNSSIPDGAGGSSSVSLTNPDATQGYLAGNPAVTTIAIDTADSKKLSVTVADAFPGLSTHSFVTVKNNGSVPVKIDDIRFEGGTQTATGLPLGQGQPWSNRLNVSLISTGSTIDGPVTLENVVLEAGEEFTFILVVHCVVGGGVLQDTTYDFDVFIDWIQWNAGNTI